MLLLKYNILSYEDSDLSRIYSAQYINEHMISTYHIYCTSVCIILSVPRILFECTTY
jgi:hypothetical protein